MSREGLAPPGPWAGLDPLDRFMVALRGVALVGGLAWWALHPLDAPRRGQVLVLFGAFAVYSILFYVVHWRHPGLLVRLYRAVMVLDLAFIFLLVRLTGGMASNFYLAFYLLIALHAFYFGLRTGVGTALLSGLLYLFSDAWPLALGPSDLALRIGFLVLVGACMGGLAERERRERRRVEGLNVQLEERQRNLREIQEQLIRSDRLATVGELAAGLAHDLRNPLAGISGALHVLAGQLSRDDPRQTLLADVQGQIARMNKTLTDLLWHARPPAPQCIDLNVNEVLEQSLWFLPTAGSGRIEVTRELDPALPAVRVDPNLLHQAFLNILVNARQAMPAGGRLRVGTRHRLDRAGGVVEVTIADTGEGIAPEHLSLIFQPFFTTKAKGTGLGLAIALRIVEQHAGRIAVDSEPGQGTTFRITLPVPADGQAWRSSDGVEAAGR